MSIDRLSALDRLMRWASRTWPQDIGALAILDGDRLFDEAGRFQVDGVRDAIRSRLHLVPRFRQVIYAPRSGLGGPLWVDAPTFDIAHHVRELLLEPPAGEAELLAAVEGILRLRFDPSRPLWEMWFLPGLRDRRVGLFVRIHHAVGDGMAAMATLASLLEPGPDMPPVEGPAWRPAPWPSGRELLLDNASRRLRGYVRGVSALARPRTTLHRVRVAWPAVREILAEKPATATSLDRMVGPRRRFALIRTSLPKAREVGRAHGGTVNDVLLAVTAGGLRAVLEHRGEPVEGTTLRIYVPVSLRRHLRGPLQGNLIAQMAVPLRLGETDPDRRLAAIAMETGARKARVRSSMSDLIVGGAVGRRLLLPVVLRQRVNATSASIPGPTRPLYLAGARILDVFPLIPLVANEPLAVGALSYAGALGIGIAADPDAYPDLDVLVAAMRHDLASLGLPIDPTLDRGIDMSADDVAAVSRATPVAFVR